MIKRSTLRQWFRNPRIRGDPPRREYYLCAGCGKQTCDGVYFSTCSQCNSIISNPPPDALSRYFCTDCSRKRDICRCDYPSLTASSPPDPSLSRSPTPPPCQLCCGTSTQCHYTCNRSCCCPSCSHQSSSCRECCISNEQCSCYCLQLFNFDVIFHYVSKCESFLRGKLNILMKPSRCGCSCSPPSHR